MRPSCSSAVEFSPCLTAALLVSACAPSALPTAEGSHRSAVLSLEHAGTAKATPEQRGALYLQAAREASALVGSPTSGVAARSIYNKAAADLTLLLRSSENEALRNRPLAITTGNTVCHLRFAKGSRDGVRDPAYFTPFTPAAEVGLKTIDRRNLQDGIGGALVGIRKSRSYGKA